MVKFLGSDSTRLGSVCPSQQETVFGFPREHALPMLLSSGFTQDTLTFLEDLHTCARAERVGVMNADKRGNAGKAKDEQQRFLRTPLLRNLLSQIVLLDAGIDTYVSVHRFKGKRCNENVCALTALQLDLDFYKKDSKWCTRADDDPQKLVEDFHALCRSAGLPVPSLITYSRGLQALWILERTVPKAALVRWKLMEKALVSKFTDFGADACATDAARVFRLPGTVNTKNGKVCRIVSRVTDESGALRRFNFEDLANCLLEVGRAECEQHRAPASFRGRGKTTVRRGAVPAVRCKFFYQHAFDDILKLIDIRGGIAEGGRMITLYLISVAACHAGLATPETLDAEAAKWAKKIDPTWDPQESALVSVKDRCARAQAGELIDFQGRKVSPLYTPSRRTLIDLLDITEEEQKQLKTLCFADCNSQERKNAKRRKNLDRDIAVIRNGHVEKVSGVKQLHADGKSAAEIAKALGINRRTVYKYLKEQEAAPASSSVPAKRSAGKGDCAARVADARDMRRKGISVPEIARRIRVAVRTVQRYLQGMPELAPAEVPPLPANDGGQLVPDTALFCGGAMPRRGDSCRDGSSQRVAPVVSLREGSSYLSEEVGNSGVLGVGPASEVADAVGSALPQGGAEGGKRGLGLGKRRFSDMRLQEIREIPLEEAVVRIGGSVTVDRTFKPRKDPSTRRFEAQFEGHTWEVVATGMKFVARSKADAATVKTSAEGGGAIDLAKVITGHEFISVVTLLSNYITALT